MNQFSLKCLPLMSTGAEQVHLSHFSTYTLFFHRSWRYAWVQYKLIVCGFDTTIQKKDNHHLLEVMFSFVAKKWWCCQPVSLSYVQWQRYRRIPLTELWHLEREFNSTFQISIPLKKKICLCAFEVSSARGKEWNYTRPSVANAYPSVPKGLWQGVSNEPHVEM